MPGIEVLPVALLQHVLTFVDGDYVVDVVPKTPQLPTKLFETLSCVSVAWADAIHELQRQHEATTLHIHIKTGLQDELEAIFRRVEEHGAQVRALKLSMGVSHQYIATFGIRMARQNDEHLDEVEIDWDRLFTVLPQLQRLDISNAPLHMTHMPKILLAASSHCRNMKALVLPQREWHRQIVTMELMPTIEALYVALERWHHSTQTNGLVQLTLPQRVVKIDDDQADYHALTDAYLDAIARFCPNIEYLDGWKASYIEDSGRIRCQELLYCSRSAMETFCRSCTKLREVNWFVLPFVDDFFNVFATNPKPSLEKLILAAGDHEDFPDSAVSGEYYHDGEWKSSSSAIARVIQACPNLRELQADFRFNFFEDQDRHAKLDDACLVSAATHCRKLQRLKIENLHHSTTDGVMRDITDAGITAVAALPELRSIELKATACEAPGILSLVRQAPTEGMPRVVDMVIGDKGDSAPTRQTKHNVSYFHDIAIDVLLGILESSEEAQGHRFQVTLRGEATLAQPDLAMKKKALQTMTTELKRVCPWLSVTSQEKGIHCSIVLASKSSDEDDSSQSLEVEKAPSDESYGAWSTLRDFLHNTFGWPWGAAVTEN
ncbi:hypothetical protein Poli38472_005207 [Pythium oligandrum]|uniref:F-box domain-containing protein n=1 Tax=Pythium oligandrum TaxID=41045 RepID=A0A8K1CFM1_PYTOL|nr:hypothetical protein Poli38472_005207 [Pythium oligandrum]|eukprot:TMW62589.1 hypothetical protein Poli38472_005207 [Pythium oligandrum]